MIYKQFNRLTRRIAIASASPWAFLLALLSILVWAISGLYFGYGNPQYQLVINTGTTIVTFLLLFILQNTQVVSETAIQLKLDELIVASEKANNRLVGIENAEEEERIAAKEGHAIILTGP